MGGGAHHHGRAACRLRGGRRSRCSCVVDRHHDRRGERRSSFPSFPVTCPTICPNINRYSSLWAKLGQTDSGGGAIPMFPRLPRVLQARITTSLPPPAPLVGMSSSQVQPLAQGPPSLVKGSRASGSVDEVLVIALAALRYDKRCGGDDGNGHSLEDFMQALEGFSHVARRPHHGCRDTRGRRARRRGHEPHGDKRGRRAARRRAAVARSGGERARRRSVR